MAEETTKKKGQLAAAVLAGSALTFSSFAVGVPAAWSAEEATPTTVAAASEEEAPAEDPEPSASETTTDDSDDSEAGDLGEEAEPTEQVTEEETNTEPSVEPSPEAPSLRQMQPLVDGDDGDEANEEDENEDAELAELRFEVSPRSGSSETQIHVSGSGFSPGGQIDIEVVSSDNPDAEPIEHRTFFADVDGELNDVMQVTGASGLYQVTATDKKTDRSEVDTFNITDVTMSVDPGTLSDEEFRDSGVTLTIEELDSNQVVDVAVGNRYNPIDALSDSATANDAGVATFDIHGADDLADIYVGTYRVVVNESGSDVQLAEGSFDVTSETPRVSTSPQTSTDGAVRQGEVLEVTGYNATPNDTVTIDYGIDDVPDEEVDTDEDGQFGTEFKIPEDAASGVKTLTLTDDETEVTTRYTVVESPRVELDVEEAYPGENITVEGEGFTSNAEIEISINPTLAKLEAGDDGRFATDVTIPEDLEPGDYTLTVANQNNAGESASQSFEVLDPADRPQIELEDTEVYQGEELQLKAWNLTANRDVEVEWNPTARMTANAEGELEAELPIADDAETGVQTLTVTDIETGAWNSVEYTVLEAVDVEASLNIDPERIELDDFIGDPDDGAGVLHVVEGLESGAEIGYVVSGPEYVNDYESTATADEDGVATFTIHGYDVTNPAVYLGEYNTVVTYTDEEDETATLSGSFVVVDEEGSTGGDAEDSEGAGGSTSPVDVNGSSGLAQTGATGVQLGLLAGGLLLAGAVLVALANRHRLFRRTT